MEIAMADNEKVYKTAAEHKHVHWGQSETILIE
jgi:hypothetical protein